MKKRFKAIKDHFENEAAVFDKFFFKVMPRYEDMMRAVIEALPFKKNDKLKIVDLGCGTGNLSGKLIQTFPNARIICIDMAENMIKMSRAKLGDVPNVRFWKGDIRDFDYSEKYDVIAASMVLHHVEAKDKPRFYKKIFNALSKNGIFICIDILLSPDAHVQKLYIDNWVEYMKSNHLPASKIKDMITRHQNEDRPAVFGDELDIMRKAGFKRVEVILKNYFCAVYYGRKS